MDSGPLYEDYDNKYKLNKGEGKLFIMTNYIST